VKITVQRVANFVLQFLIEYFPRVAYFKGGGVWDMFIHAFARIFNAIFELIDRAANSSWLGRDTSVSEDYDKAGEFHFLPRNTGGYSRGVIRIYMPAPTRVVIPKGWRIGADFVFQATDRHVFNSSTVAKTYSGNEYYIQFPLQAIEKGSAYDVAENTITDLKDPLWVTFNRITNPSAFSGGSDTETDEEYYARLETSINTRNLLITDGSVTSTLGALFPTFNHIGVVGYRDEGMERDIYFGISGPGGFVPYVSSTFALKISGSLVSNLSVAKKLTSETATPPNDYSLIDAVADELTSEEYRMIAGNDLIYLTAYASRLYADTFPSTTRDYTPEGLIVSDSGLPYGQKRYDDSVYEQEGLRMGSPPGHASVIYEIGKTISPVAEAL
jgi:hypothetical protein